MDCLMMTEVYLWIYFTQISWAVSISNVYFTWLTVQVFVFIQGPVSSKRWSRLYFFINIFALQDVGDNESIQYLKSNLLLFINYIYFFEKNRTISRYLLANFKMRIFSVFVGESLKVTCSAFSKCNWKHRLKMLS